MVDCGNELALDTSKMRYPMTKTKLGNVYLFNHVTFDDESLGARYGTIKDRKDIEETFQSLKFDVIVYNDLNHSEILEKISSIAEMDYTNLGCIVIFVLTHGNYGKIFAKDVDYYPDIYWNTLNENSSLSSKPKLIFVQASGGGEFDEENDTFYPLITFSIPNIPDVLLMYSIYDWFYSWRNQVSGSSFIQDLCKELKLHAKNTDIVTLLTSLNQTMMMHECSVGTIVSTLTRSLYFKS